MGIKAVYKQRSDGFWQTYWENENLQEEAKKRALSQNGSTQTLPDSLGIGAIIDFQTTNLAYKDKEEVIVSDGIKSSLLSFKNSNDGESVFVVENEDLMNMLTSPQNISIKSGAGNDINIQHDKDGGALFIVKDANGEVINEVEYSSDEMDQLMESAWNNYSKNSNYNPFIDEFSHDFQLNSHQSNNRSQGNSDDQETKEIDVSQAKENYKGDSPISHTLPISNDDFSEELGSKTWPYSGIQAIEKVLLDGEIPEYAEMENPTENDNYGFSYYFPQYKPQSYLEAAWGHAVIQADIERKNYIDNLAIAEEKIKNDPYAVDETIYRDASNRALNEMKTNIGKAHVFQNKIFQEMNQDDAKSRLKSIPKQTFQQSKRILKASNNVRKDFLGEYRKRRLQQEGIPIPPRMIPDPSLSPEAISLMKKRGGEIPMVKGISSYISKREYNKLLSKKGERVREQKRMQNRKRRANSVVRLTSRMGMPGLGRFFASLMPNR